MTAAIEAPASRLFTLGQLVDAVREAGGPAVHIHQLKYAIETRRIPPATRVGIMRVWSESALPAIREALADVAVNRERRGQ